MTKTSQTVNKNTLQAKTAEMSSKKNKQCQRRESEGFKLKKKGKVGFKKRSAHSFGESNKRVAHQKGKMRNHNDSSPHSEGSVISSDSVSSSPKEEKDVEIQINTCSEVRKSANTLLER